MSEKLVEVQHLQQYFPAGGMGKNKKYVQAVDDVSFAINKGETLGLVGESGCGKTTTGRTLLRLYEPTKGRILYDGETLFDSGNVPLYNEDGTPVLDESGKPKFGKKTAVNMLPYRRKMQIVFQDPYASLDPRMTVGDIVGEAIDIHRLASSKADRRERIIKMLERVGLNSEHANRYPHEFSGGQRQRVGIARALAVDPQFIVCDEPISAVMSRRSCLERPSNNWAACSIRRSYSASGISGRQNPSHRPMWKFRQGRSAPMSRGNCRRQVGRRKA